MNRFPVACLIPRFADAFPPEAETQPRAVCRLRNHWRFSNTLDTPEAANPEFDDAAWQTVRVPHDWAIAGPFDRENDLQTLAIWEDGEEKPSPHTARTGALPHVGVGWYRRRFHLPKSFAARRIQVEFDGVMSQAAVFVNGAEVGRRPYGYISFAFDITDAVRFDAENLLAVRVDNPPCASRWYPGAGIYRNVRLVALSPVHIPQWGVTIRTPKISTDSATVLLQTRIAAPGQSPIPVRLTTKIVAPDGALANSATWNGAAGPDAPPGEQALEIRNPRLWDTEAPALYFAVTELRQNHRLLDRVVTRFGIRSIEFSPDRGFRLNGRRIRLNGVCMHHDLGALGAAVHRRAIQRQVEILQKMGANAIRTSHNPPAPELLDVCDEMGVLVMDEAFDEWRTGKVENGYHRHFDAWAETDLRDMIRRDRNHPCVILWSIGNEVPDQARPEGRRIARKLTEICRREDPTRPVTAGFNNADAAIDNGLAAEVDIPGWNYKPNKYAEYHARFPDWIMLGSETASCVSSRGEYAFPAVPGRDVHRPSLHCSSYDLETPPWATLPDTEFQAQDECPFMLGEFVWTGFDYLGEPTPYNPEWPSRSSYFGIVDLAGFPKDRYCLYRSRWSTLPTLHLVPDHWTWPNRRGQTVPVFCYTNAPAAELFLNGRSLGVRRKNPDSLLDRYRLRWMDVPYEPGVLLVRALDAGGRILGEASRITAGAPAAIQLEPDRTPIRADGEDLAFVTVRIVDAAGVRCPNAASRIVFTVDGPAEIAAVDNGDPTSLEPFAADRRHAFHGLCLVILRSIENRPGNVRLTAEAAGLSSAQVTIETVAETGEDATPAEV